MAGKEKTYNLEERDYKMMANLNPNLILITLNVNELTAPIKNKGHQIA